MQDIKAAITFANSVIGKTFYLYINVISRRQGRQNPNIKTSMLTKMQVCDQSTKLWPRHVIFESWLTKRITTLLLKVTKIKHNEPIWTILRNII